MTITAKNSAVNRTLVALLTTAAIAGAGFVSPASADPYNAHARYHNHSNKYHNYNGYNGYYDYRPTYFERHPYQKSGLIGAGVGAAAGALMGNEYDRGGSAVKGAVLGGAAGLGYRYLQNNGMWHL